MARFTFRRAVGATRTTQRGFTLAELCAALGVAGVLAAAGMPAMTSLHGKVAVDAQAQGLMSALRLARQEAVKRGELVSVCAMDPASEAGAPECLVRGKDWSAGWLIFVDRDQRGEIDGSDLVLSVAQAPAAAPVVGTARYMTYRTSGVLLSAMGHFRVLPPGQPAVDADGPGAALVCVNRTGRPRLADAPECD
jgi:type IV fimbrial biogenesis protein FimT